MIDFHSHLLHGIDDGSRSIDETIKMLHEYAEQKVSHIILTPHYYPYKTDPETFFHKRNKSFSDLMNYLRNETPPDGRRWPELVLGAEVFYFAELPGIAELKRLCIGNSRYMMLEILDESWNEKIVKVFEILIGNRGIIPVIAHVEQNIHKRSDAELLRELINLGALAQINSDSLTNIFSRRKAINLFRNGAVQLLGSDCHNLSDRPPNLLKGYNILNKCGGNTVINSFFQTEKEILDSI